MRRLLSTLTLTLLITCSLFVFAARTCGRAFPGAMLAFLSPDDFGSSTLYVLDVSRFIPILLGHTDFVASPTWSTDGRLAFVSTETGNTEIYIWDGITQINVSQHRLEDYAPAWSIDGRLAFQSNRDSNWEIYVWNNGLLINISQHAVDDSAPAWSTDGRLAFRSGRDGNWEVYMWDGTTLTNISQNVGSDNDYVWSADGRLAFVSQRGVDYELYVWDNGILIEVFPYFENYIPAWDTNGQLVFEAVESFDNREIHEWDSTSITNLSRMPDTSEYAAVLWTP